MLQLFVYMPSMALNNISKYTTGHVEKARWLVGQGALCSLGSTSCSSPVISLDAVGARCPIFLGHFLVFGTIQDIGCLSSNCITSCLCSPVLSISVRSYFTVRKLGLSKMIYGRSCRASCGLASSPKAFFSTTPVLFQRRATSSNGLFCWKQNKLSESFIEKLRELAHLRATCTENDPWKSWQLAFSINLHHSFVSRYIPRQTGVQSL